MVLRTRNYGDIECFGHKNYVFYVDFPIGAAVDTKELAFAVGSPFACKDLLHYTAVSLFKDITGAKKIRVNAKSFGEMLETFCKITLRNNPVQKGRYQTNEYNEATDFTVELSDILAQYPIILQTFGGKFTMVLRFTLNKPFRISGKEHTKVYNYCEEKWIDFYSEIILPFAKYGIFQILDWVGIIKGDCQYTNSERVRKMRKGV